jgi:hypothetical protein
MRCRRAPSQSVLVAALTASLGLCPAAVTAQPNVTHRGSIAAMVDGLPNVDATELRVRVEDTLDVEVNEAWTIRAGSWIDALAGSRRGDGAADLVYQPGEIHARYRHDRFDLTAGFQRVVWGTLDEIQPTDVVNPLDISRFLFDGRSDARLPVLALRGRLFLPDDTTIDAVYVPFFRRGRYDLVDEDTSPFNLLAGTCLDEVCAAGGSAVLRLSQDPPRTVGSGSVGARVSRTAAGVDLSASIYRGWQAFPLASIAAVPDAVTRGASAAASPGAAVVLSESWSRITMIGMDAEAARGAVTWRAEGAVLVDTAVQSQPGAPTADGRSLQIGAGLDWTVRAWRTFGNVIGRRAWAVGSRAALVPASGGIQLVGGAERKFTRDTRLVRAFAVVDPTQGTSFVRGLGAWNVRDNLWLEASAAWLAGDGMDFLGQYTDRDFVSVRVKYYF